MRGTTVACFALAPVLPERNAGSVKSTLWFLASHRFDQ